MHGYVLWSYRTYLPQYEAWRKPVELKRQVKLLHRGRKWLSMLRRANEGYLKPLEKVLMLTYGRTGKRRRELMQELMAPEPPQTSEEIVKVSAPKLYLKGWKPPVKVDLLMKSQSQQRKWLDRFQGKVKTDSKIPSENIWGKPLPTSRLRNATHKWYVKQVDQLFPPLPAIEQKELQMLATGEKDWCGPVKRRTQTQANSDEKHTAPTENTLLEGPEKGQSFSKYINGRPHYITPRIMRRLWAVVFKHVPVLEQRPYTSKWSIQWGDPDKPIQLVVPPMANRDALLFPKSSSEPLPPTSQRMSMSA